MTKRHIVRVCCSDGFNTKPSAIRGNVIHEIRNPGGILFPNLYARDVGGTDPNVVTELLRIGDAILVRHIDTMVRLKTPSEIILQAHSPCAAANMLGLSVADVHRIHTEWEMRLRELYPSIHISTWFEEHSACGCERKAHVLVHAPLVMHE